MNIARDIANYIMINGMQNSSNGSWIVYFNEINKIYGVNLPENTVLLKEIVKHFDYNIVAEVDITDCFDLVFYTKYIENEVEL